MTQSPSNMFFEAFKQYTDKDAFVNMFKNFGNCEHSKFTELAQKNLDTMIKAGQISAENSQAIMRRILEIGQKYVADTIEVSRDLMASPNPEHAMQKQQQFVKLATADAISNSKEMVEMGAKSMMEVFDIFAKKMSENMEQCHHNVHDVTKKAK